MSGMIPFAFEEKLVRAVHRGDVPWFAGKDVCDCLCIRDYNQALQSLDDDERGKCTILTPGGNQTMIVISEPGVYRLVFRSRKPEAERFKRWLAHDVLPKLRRGEPVQPADPAPSPHIYDEATMRAAPLLHRLQCIREVRSVAGQHAARVMWNRLGLPPLPPPPPTDADEARACLRHLLDGAPFDGGPTVRQSIELALDDDLEAQAVLIGAGLRVMPDSEAFVVANDHPRLRMIFEGSPWATPRAHVYVLRRLPGVGAGRQLRYGDHIQRRGTLIPAALLDDR